MEIQLLRRLSGQKLAQWTALLEKTGLHGQPDGDATVLLYDEDDTLAATGTRQGNLLKYIAVDPAYQGQDLTARVLTALRQDAMEAGLRHLFLYTKPQNESMFASLFFYPIAKTDQVLLMENRRGGIQSFLAQQPVVQTSGTVGAAVMNCNPFTLGHQYLVETAASRCDQLYIFVLSEDKSRFSAADRLEMVRRGTAHLPNVTVLPTGPYLISSATFPTYFLKDREQAGSVQCSLDIEIFAQYYAPHFGITHRFVGTEPLSPMTGQYNEALKAHLPERGIVLTEIPRLETGDAPISATAVRQALDDGGDFRHLVPNTTYEYLIQGGFCHA